MATSPAFATTPRVGSVSIATADSSYTAPSNVGTVLTGVAAGTRIAEVVVKCAATSAAAIVRLFLHDGTNYWLFDEVTIAAATGSSTVQQTRVSVVYNNLILPSASWSLRATTSVSQATHVTALGADL
ncbi:hypothetical protein EBZ38_14890 [bacterium]|nr:hypothetical protein [bacterium]NDD85545.1 hypothetical protein [bacterium]